MSLTYRRVFEHDKDTPIYKNKNLYTNFNQKKHILRHENNVMNKNKNNKNFSYC